ncbi:ABC transporter substrate-binding protein [Methanomethylophilus alvi]|uniref:ABC transporter substrate-binding protein n=1 Tax=Methanomethylophilus alvi TaxID=1291540 RepID=UPI0037DC1D95
MQAATVKLVSAAVIAMLAVTGISVIGFTADSVDARQGVMIDFGYYEVDWIEMEFPEGMTGDQALDAACAERSYPVVKDPDGSVYSVNSKTELEKVEWGMYVLDSSGNWSPVAEPSGYDVSKEKIISWARTGVGSAMMPAVDQTGFTYYSYAKLGKNPMGEDLKIVTLAPSVTETVCAVGGLDYVVGTDRYSDYPNGLVSRQNNGTISIVGGYTDPNFEKVVAENPDIVFLDGGTGEHVTMADKFRKSGINCVVLYNAVTTDDLLKNLWICASALGFPERGNDYITDVSEAINNICRIADLQDKKVFVALGVSDSPYTAGSGTYVTNMLESLGARNIFANDSNSWFMASKETVYERQPDIIIIIHDAEQITSQREYRTLLSHFNDLWKRTPAYANGEVYVFSGDAASLLSRAGARLPESLELLAKIMDPESFINEDPTDVVGVKYYNDSYNDPDNGYLRYVKAQGLLEWQRE